MVGFAGSSAAHGNRHGRADCSARRWHPLQSICGKLRRPRPGNATMLVPFDLSCPYCGETIEILVDASAGDQHYIEDCQVCCRQIMLGIRIDTEGEPQVVATSENDA